MYYSFSIAWNNAPPPLPSPPSPHPISLPPTHKREQSSQFNPDVSSLPHPHAARHPPPDPRRRHRRRHELWEGSSASSPPPRLSVCFTSGIKNGTSLSPIPPPLPPTRTVYITSFVLPVLMPVCRPPCLPLYPPPPQRPQRRRPWLVLSSRVGSERSAPRH